jgi:FdhD protein
MVSFQERALFYKDIAIGHSAALVSPKEIFYFAEDLSQMNALYRVIGLVQADVTPAPFSVLMVSGKVDLDVMRLALRLGVHTVISRLAPTDQAYQLAKSEGLTLVGFARGTRMTVYHGRVN